MKVFPLMTTVLAIAAASIAPLAGPASANANVTQEVQGERLTVKGDAQPDTIVLEALEGKIAVNGVATALKVGARTEIVVESGAGKDSVDASGLAAGSYGSLQVAGNGGDDQIGGGAESDAFFWGDGDGDDVVRGGAGRFDSLVVHGSETGNDELRLQVGPLGTTVERTNLTPFTIDLPEGQGEVEEVSINPGGGNDTVDASQAPADLLIAADGGAGNDEIVGGDGPDQLFGGIGADVINGNENGDVLFGEGGDDKLLSRDRKGDLVRGGDGEDSAQTDDLTVDTVSEVEHLDATQPPQPEAPPPPPPVKPPPPVQPPAPVDTVAVPPRLGRVTVARHGMRLVAKLPLTCPAVESGGCDTTSKLEATVATRPGKHRTVVLGSKNVKLGPGEGMTVSIPFVPLAATLARTSQLAVRIRIASSDAAGNTAARTTAAVLRVPRH